MRWIGVVLAMAACDGGALAIEAYPERWLDVACDYLVRCGATDSVASCRETRAAPELSADLLAAVTAGTVRWNGDAAEDCLDRIERASCDRTSESYRYLGCERFFTGTLGKDAACTLSTECISNECWTEGCAEACCVGYCTGDLEPEIGEIGEPCRLSRCVAGARCEDSVCVPLHEEGEPCTFEGNGECAYGLACIKRVCSPPLETGAACTIESVCRLLGERCDPRGMCSTAGQLGDLCISSNHCASHLVCGVDSHCRPAPRIGESCSYEECYEAGAFCDSTTNVCSLPKADGAACTYSRDCESGRCFDDTCVSCS